MNIQGRVAAVAVGLLMATAGVLYPIKGSLGEATGDVDRLEQELAHDGNVSEQLEAAKEALEDVQARVAALPFGLCPATPEAQHEWEAALMAQVESSGLHSIRMDRRTEARAGGYSSLTMDLVLEGDAEAMQKFLQSLESMRYVTRVTSLTVEPGGLVRRANLQIAVMLEQKS
jgi:hypothetical protein